MSTHTTPRATIIVRGNTQFEPLPQFGWRCGMNSLRPDLVRHAAHPEFLAGLRRGRAQRKSGPGISDAMGLILGLPVLRAMRQQIHAAYAEAAEADRRLASSYRAAARGAGQVSSAGRDIGELRLSHADRAAESVAAYWAQHRRLSDAYEIEVNRLFSLRGLPRR